jgi:hypothetical protein
MQQDMSNRATIVVDGGIWLSRPRHIPKEEVKALSKVIERKVRICAIQHIVAPLNSTVVSLIDQSLFSSAEFKHVTVAVFQIADS